MEKKRKAIFIVMVIIVVSSFFIPWNLLMMSLAPLPDSFQSEIDNAVNKYDLVGVIVYIDDSGDVSKFGAGYNDRDAKTNADPNLLFKIASISKLYMAVAATKLVNKGNLSLDDTLSVLLPEYKDSIEYSDEISLKMLIQHRSGIPDFLDDPEFPWANLPTNVDEALALVLGDDADFKPNAKYEYSNTNYLLLAKIMDAALGYPHDQYIKEEILTPLGLNNTYYYFNETNPDEVMSGYSVGYEFDLKLNDYILPGGSMVASITDVGIFIRALNNGSLLSESEEEIYSQIYVYGHTGLLPGYQSIARYDSKSDRVIVVFVNTSGADSWGKIDILYNRIEKISS